MKVVSPQIIAELESRAYKNGFTEESFMEAAGKGVASAVNDFIKRHHQKAFNGSILLLCGKGNNAGDAYVAGSLLCEFGFDVASIQIAPIESTTPLCKKNYERFLQVGGKVLPLQACFPKNGIVIDGIFGTGFRGTVTEPYLSVIKKANTSNLPILSIDIPSGLDCATGKVCGEAIQATETIFLGLPKLGFFLEDGWNCVGKLRYRDFGLPQSYIETCKAEFSMIDHVRHLLPKIKRDRHKYERGYVVGFAGSPGMGGAAMLSSTAALRGGAGIVRLLTSKGMEMELSHTPFEIIKEMRDYSDSEEILTTLNKASAVFLGPGIGHSAETARLINTILPNINKPCVLDADLLTLLSREEISLPQQTILTPHRGEMSRLLKEDCPKKITKDFLAKCYHYAAKKKVTLILKGAPTFIFHADSSQIFQGMINTTGDPGMATAGSGDILTGLLTALLAQGLSTKEAAILGVHLHGLAGEHAAKRESSRTMIATDILQSFSEAFKTISSDEMGSCVY